MKVKVKGLVFVGFAAMIFAANAMAADNTVTSKSYVDNKFQTIENIQTEFTEANKNSTTQYPSMSAVQAKITEVGGTVNNSTISVTQNGASIGSFTTNQSSGSTLAIEGADWNAASGTAGYIDNKPTALSQFTDDIGDQKTANLSSNMTTDTGSTTKYPSVAAVEAYVTANAAPTTAEENVQANWNETDTTSDAYIQNKPTALSQFTDDLGDQKTANLSSDMTTDTGSTTKYPSVKAVEDYVDALPAADIPAMPNTCTAAAPCVLTNDTEDGTLTWVPIQQ